jgi:hypothetical protein
MASKKKNKNTDNSSVIIGKDLVINALKCIDAAANRGAYQGGELSTVGQVRDSLYILVSSEVEKAAADAQEQDNSDD